MKQITIYTDYEKIINQSTVPAVFLFVSDSIDSSMAEVAINQLSTKYKEQILFYKLCHDEDYVSFNQQLVSLPLVQVVSDGMQMIYRNPIAYDILESKILAILQTKAYSVYSDLPSKPERIKKGLLEKNWIAWTVIIGGILIAVIKFLHEITKDNNSNRR